VEKFLLGCSESLLIPDWIRGAAPAEDSGETWILRGLGSVHMAKGFVEGTQIQEAPMGLQVEDGPGGRYMLWGQS
jgi:hypothetical protein